MWRLRRDVPRAVKLPVIQYPTATQFNRWDVFERLVPYGVFGVIGMPGVGALGEGVIGATDGDNDLGDLGCPALTPGSEWPPRFAPPRFAPAAPFR